MIKRRNLFVQLILFVVTFGLYLFYWYYVTTKEMLRSNGMEGSPGFLTFLLFVPFVNLYAYWKHSDLLDGLTGSRYNKVLVFLLWLFFSPAVWIITQVELNRRSAAEGPSALSGTQT